MLNSILIRITKKIRIHNTDVNKRECRVPCVGMGADVLIECVLVLERLPALFAPQVFRLNLVQEPTKIREGKLKQVVVYGQIYVQGSAMIVFF
jgi:hypothetical protein